MNFYQTISHPCFLSFSCTSERLGSQSFADMFYEQKRYVRDDDVTSHVTSLNFFISLLSCLFRRLCRRVARIFRRGVRLGSEDTNFFFKINFISLFTKKTQYKQESKIKVCLIYKNLYQSITTIDKYSRKKLCGGNKNYIRVFQHLHHSCY